MKCKSMITLIAAVAGQCFGCGPVQGSGDDTPVGSTINCVLQNSDAETSVLCRGTEDPCDAGILLTFGYNSASASGTECSPEYDKLAVEIHWPDGYWYPDDLPTDNPYNLVAHERYSSVPIEEQTMVIFYDEKNVDDNGDTDGTILYWNSVGGTATLEAIEVSEYEYPRFYVHVVGTMQSVDGQQENIVAKLYVRHP